MSVIFGRYETPKLKFNLPQSPTSCIDANQITSWLASQFDLETTKARFCEVRLARW